MYNIYLIILLYVVLLRNIIASSISVLSGSNNKFVSHISPTKTFSGSSGDKEIEELIDICDVAHERGKPYQSSFS